MLIVAAAEANDVGLAAQRAALMAMGSGAGERDLTVVTLVGDGMTGASDAAAALRKTYGLPDYGFAVVLLGKDGGVKMRSATPVSAATLMGVIDAMPMRRAEQRPKQ